MSTSTPPKPSPSEEEEEEEDYMSMTITEPTLPKTKETYTQRRQRLARESEARSRPKSKAELLAEETAAREAALSKSLLSNAGLGPKSKGLAMMAKMGFTPGKTLGKEGNEEARLEPIGINMKEGKGGIGLDEERKRKMREEWEGERKRVKAEEGDYRERVRKEREEGRLEGLVGSAMRVAERMEGEREEEENRLKGEDGSQGEKRKVSTKPLKSINVLWRGLVRKREEKERERRMRYDLHQSLSRLPTYDDAEEDKDDKKALGKNVVRYTLVEDLEEEDPELDAFAALEPTERLEKLVAFLRESFNYCFYCKYTYPDKEMDGCPGLTEEDHD